MIMNSLCTAVVGAAVGSAATTVFNIYYKQEKHIQRERRKEHVKSKFIERAQSLRDVNEKVYNPFVEDTGIERCLETKLKTLTTNYYGICMLLSPPDFGKSTCAKKIAKSLYPDYIQGAVVYNFENFHDNASSIRKQILKSFGDEKHDFDNVEDMFNTQEKTDRPLLVILDQMEKLDKSKLDELESAMASLATMSVNYRKVVYLALCSDSEHAEAVSMANGGSKVWPAEEGDEMVKSFVLSESQAESLISRLTKKNLHENLKMPHNIHKQLVYSCQNSGIGQCRVWVSDVCESINKGDTIDTIDTKSTWTETSNYTFKLLKDQSEFKKRADARRVKRDEENMSKR